MSRVSYQAMLDPDRDASVFVPLHPTAIATRRRDARITYEVRLSPRQRRWLEETATIGGLPADRVALAAVDLLIALDLDWSAIGRPADLRAAIIDAVRVRRERGTA